MPEHVRDHLGRFGVWRSGGQVTPELAAEIEQLGFGALWLGGSPSGDLGQAEQLLGATATVKLATGIVNMWQSDVMRSWRRSSGSMTSIPAGSCWAWARATVRPPNGTPGRTRRW